MTAKSVLESAAGGTAPGALSQAATTDDQIKAALAKLDPANNDHWLASTGRPAMDAVNALLPAPITRARLDEVAPDFVRPAKTAEAGSQPPADNDHVAEGDEPFSHPGEGVGEQTADRDPLERRIAALEDDLAFLRALFGWPTKGA